jgi:hypothetical protein
VSFVSKNDRNDLSLYSYALFDQKILIMQEN